MIETIVLNHLSDQLSVPVYMEEPEAKHTEYVLIEKIGSTENEHISSATFAVQSYAGSLYQAARLNDSVKAAMASILSLPSVTRIELNSDYNYTDTETKRYRYQAVFDITYYE